MTNEIAFKRLENNHYAIKKSTKRLEQAIEERDEMEVYAAIGESLLWVLTTDEWHKKHNPGYCDRKKRHEKGKILFDLIKENNFTFVSSVEEIRENNYAIEHPPIRHKYRDKVYKKLKYDNFQKIADKYLYDLPKWKKYLVFGIPPFIKKCIPYSLRRWFTK